MTTNGWGRTPQSACKTVVCAIVGVVWRKVKKGANKALGRDENAGKEVEDEVKDLR